MVPVPDPVPDRYLHKKKYKKIRGPTPEKIMLLMKLQRQDFVQIFGLKN
jgi:hypothetical protein